MSFQSTFKLLTGWFLLGLSFGQVVGMAAAPIRAEPSRSRPDIAAAAITSKLQSQSRFYSYLEVRHHLNTHYDDAGLVDRQYPSLHLRVQVGASFYQDRLDVYATFGVIKIADSQQVLQRRPEFATDYYLVKNPIADLRLYNILMLPFKKAVGDQFDGGDVDTDRYVGDYQTALQADGTVHTLGLGGRIRAKIPIFDRGQTFVARLAGNTWTHLYSRRQVIVSSVDTADSVAEASSELDDRKLRLGLRQQAGIGWIGLRGKLSVYLDGYYRSFFYPSYVDSKDLADNHYAVHRKSYTRFRLRYQLSERISLTNDFFQFHQGFFAKQTRGSERRYRNVARIVCAL